MALTLCAFFLLGGCSDDDTTPSDSRPPTETERADLEAALAHTAVEGDGATVRVMGDLSGLLIDRPGPVHVVPGVTSQTLRFGPWSWSLEITCLTAAGGVVECQAEPEVVEVTLAWTGQVTLPRRSVEGRYQGSWQLTRLAGERVVIDGDGELWIEGAFDSASGANSKTTLLNWVAVYDDIVVDTARRDPVDGSASYAIRIEREHETPGRTRVDVTEARAVVEFDDGRAWLTVADGERRRLQTRE
ncbi:MAG: hypothetical protein H6704_02475 [Myxococcales bacterium]|nr:hypothetical protein [Myxococcales bacterium]